MAKKLPTYDGAHKKLETENVKTFFIAN